MGGILDFTISSQSDEWYHQYKQQDLRVVQRTQLGQIKCIVKLYRMNYERIRPDIGSISETCLKQVLAASGC